jgi:hypothetical protein
MKWYILSGILMYSPLVHLVNRIYHSPMFLSLSPSPHIIQVTTGHVKSENTSMDQSVPTYDFKFFRHIHTVWISLSSNFLKISEPNIIRRLCNLCNRIRAGTIKLKIVVFVTSYRIPAEVCLQAHLLKLQSRFLLELKDRRLRNHEMTLDAMS